MGKKTTKTTQIIMLMVGVLLMLSSFIIYKFSTITFLLEVHSEIFGAGAAVAVVGLVWLLFKVKLD